MRGGSARVAIDVAIAFAVSWNPLVKSNASAVPTTITSRAVVSLTLLFYQCGRTSGAGFTIRAAA